MIILAPDLTRGSSYKMKWSLFIPVPEVLLRKYIFYGFNNDSDLSLIDDENFLIVFDFLFLEQPK